MLDLGSLVGRVVLDVTQFDAGYTRVITRMRGLGTEAGKTTKTTGGLDTALRGTGVTATQLARNLELTSGTTSRLTAAQLQLSAVQDQAALTARRWGSSTDDVARAQAQLVRAQSAVTAASAEAATVSGRVQAALLRQQAAQERLTALEATGKATTGQLAAANAALISASNAVTTAEARQADAIRATATAGAGATAQAGGLKGAYRGAAAAIEAIPGPVKAAAVATAVGLALAGKAAADFDNRMALVQTLSRDSASEMEQLRKAALSVGQQYGYTASQVADAEAELIKAGVSTKDILGGALTGALTLAAAGQEDVANATETATIAMTQFKLSGQDVPHIADLLSAGADKALGSVSDLSEGLKEGGLSASMAGWSIESTVGTLAEFAQNGLMGEKAGNALKAMFQNLENASGPASDEIKQLGLQVYDANGNFVSASNLAGQLHDKLGSLDPAARNAALGIIFSNKAILAAQILTKDGAQVNAEWTKTVDDQGFAAQQASGKLDSLSGDWQKFKAAASTAAIEIGEHATPALRALVHAGTDVASFVGPALNALAPPARAVGEALQFVAHIVEPLTPEIVPLVAAFVAMKVASAAASNVALLGAAIKGAALAAADATIAMGEAGLAGAASMLTNPVGIATLGVGLLTYGILRSIEASNRAAAAAKKWAQSLGESTDPSNYKSLDALNTAYDKSQATFTVNRDKLQVLNKELAANAGAAGQSKTGSDNLNASLKAAAVAYDQNKTKLGGLNATLKQSTSDQDALNAKWNEVAHTVGVTASQAYLLAEKHGVTLTGSAKDIEAALKDQIGAASSAAASGKELADADNAAGDAMSAASDAAKALSDALKGLNGDQIDAATAQNDLTQSIADMKTALDGSSHSIDGVSAAGAKNQNVLLGLLSSAEELSVKQVQATGHSDEATAAYGRNYAAIIAAAKANGLNAAAVAALIKQYHLTPAEVDTVISNNAPQAEAQSAPYIAAMQWLAAHPNLKTDFTFVEHGFQAGQTAAQLEQELAAKYTYASGGPVSGPGTGTSDSILARLSNGEFVVTAAAASKYGPFLEAINAGQQSAVVPTMSLPRAGGGASSSTDALLAKQNVLLEQILAKAGHNGPLVGTIQTGGDMTLDRVLGAAARASGGL